MPRRVARGAPLCWTMLTASGTTCGGRRRQVELSHGGREASAAGSLKVPPGRCLPDGASRKVPPRWCLPERAVGPSWTPPLFSAPVLLHCGAAALVSCCRFGVVLWCRAAAALVSCCRGATLLLSAAPAAPSCYEPLHCRQRCVSDQVYRGRGIPHHACQRHLARHPSWPQVGVYRTRGRCLT